ncbi:MAG: hypothetical protein HFH18_06755 [Ruminococcus sp.]|nr:hypothetical protein [Ruminococcus sp.]
MKKRYMIILICLAFSLIGCSRQKMNRDRTDSNTSNRLYMQTSGNVGSTEQRYFFPASYSEQSGKINIKCNLEVPQEFEMYNFHIPKVKDLRQYNTGKAYTYFIEGKEILEEQVQLKNTYYTLTDGSSIAIGECLSYDLPESEIYRRIIRSSERMAPQRDFSFGTGDSCVTKIKELLEGINYPIEEFSFSWFSTSGKEYSILEQRAYEDNVIGSKELKSGGWTEDNDAYEIYAWQIYENIPIFPQIMTTNMTRAVESYQRAPISAVYNKKGLLTLMAEAPYEFESTEEIAVFKSFSEIAKNLIKKYENLLDDCSYSVTRAKLAIRVYFDKKQQYQAEPVWYFEVYDNELNMEIAMFNAITGKEIYLR